MNDTDDRDQEDVDVEQEAADAWAAVYIDVSEKLDEQEREKQGLPKDGDDAQS